MHLPKSRLVAAAVAFAAVVSLGLLVRFSTRVTVPDDTPSGWPPARPQAQPRVVTLVSEKAEVPLPAPTGLPPAGLRKRSPSPWRVREAQWRQIVEIALAPVERPRGELLAGGAPAVPLTARLEISLGGPPEASVREGASAGVRVFDSRGGELAAELSPVEGTSAFELVFEAPGGGADGPFEVYYPVTGGKALRPERAAGGVTLSVYALEPGSTEGLAGVRDVARVAKAARRIERPRRRSQIDDCKLPFDRHDYYVAVYQAYLACREDGLHGFGLDADDRAYLVIDGEPVLAGGAPNKLPKSPFPYRASRSLRAGLHALTLYHVQGKGALRARLAWQPPGSRRMRVIPPSAFVSHLPARAVALERRDGPSVEPFFSAALTRRLVVNRSVPVTGWELVASGSAEAPMRPARAVGVPARRPGSPAPVYTESGGLCVMEAERFTGIDRRSDTVSWSVARERKGYSGTGYARTVEKSAGDRAPWRDSCEISYRVEISRPGEYHIAWRHLSPDDDTNSAWTGLDGENRSEDVGYHKQLTERWTWQRGASPLGRLGAGVHTIHIRRREAGFSLDRLAIAMDPDRLPADNSPEAGPPESPRSASLTRMPAPAGRGDLAASPQGSLRWVWREGARVLGGGERLRLFVSGFDFPRVGARPWREITLTLEGSSGELGRYRRRLWAKPHDPLEDEELSFRIRTGAAPSFLYPAEPFEIHLAAVNDSGEPVLLEAVEVRLERSGPGDTGGRGEARALGEFKLPAVGVPGIDVIARRMNRIRRRFEPGECERIERLVYLLGPPGAPAMSLEFVLLDSRSRRWPELRAEAGALVVPQAGRSSAGPGRAVRVSQRRTRAIFMMPYDSDGDLRRWALFRNVSLEGRDRREALLFGDSLASPGAVGGEGLAPRMRARLGRVNLRVAPFPPGDWPICAAVAGVSGELARAKWGRVWISLGTLDVRAGTPLRQYERGIDLLVDRAWSLAPRSRLVIVGPPPEPGREDVSARYAEAAAHVARRHRVAYVDLHGLVMSLADPDAAYRESGPDDGVRFPYPLGEAMDAVARAVLGK